MKYQINKLRIIFSQEKYSIFICMKFVQQPTRLFCESKCLLQKPWGAITRSLPRLGTLNTSSNLSIRSQRLTEDHRIIIIVMIIVSTQQKTHNLPWPSMTFYECHEHVSKSSFCLWGQRPLEAMEMLDKLVYIIQKVASDLYSLNC